jgi:hypothetical protein
MACACKVNKQIEKINKLYGNKKEQPKTNIKNSFSIILYNILIYLLYIPLIPILSVYIILRKLFTNKPISLDGFIKRNKNVRNK